MSLKYKTPPAEEGGSAIKGVGTIHIDEIRETLNFLATKLDLGVDLNKFVVGSVGKKEYSGDIDIIADPQWWPHDMESMKSLLVSFFGSDSVSGNKSMVHLRCPIQGYNIEKRLSLPRTGYVQVDFIPGDYKWKSVFYYSAGDKSEYKSAHRNIALSSVCAVVDVKSSVELDWYSRPVRTEKWKWSPDGFFRIIRSSVKEEFTGVCKKKQVDTVIGEPILDADKIVEVLFGKNATVECLNSFESVLGAIDAYCGTVEKEKIWRKCAENLLEWKYGKDFVYPDEISKYMV